MIALKWIATLLFIGILLIAIRFIFDIDGNITRTMWGITAVVMAIFHHYTAITRKPFVSVKAKVIRSWAVSHTIHSPYRIEFLFPDKKVINLMVSKKQVYAVKKNDVVDLIYQGEIVRSIRKYPNGVIIFHDEFSQMKIEKIADKILTYKQATKRK